MITKRQTLVISLGAVGCLLCAGLYYMRVTGRVPSLSPHVERTANKDSDWHRKAFESSLLSLQRERESVVAVYGRRSDLPRRRTERWTTGFTIRRPDDHGSITYTVDAIDAEGVDLSYESSFSHVSFGRNLVSRDRGTFRLPWLSAELVRYVGNQPELTVTLLPDSDATDDEIARVSGAAKRAFHQLCAVKTEIWEEPAAIIERDTVWSVHFEAKARVLIVNGQEKLVEPGPKDGMGIPLIKPDLTCVLTGDPLPRQEANKADAGDGK